MQVVHIDMNCVAFTSNALRNFIDRAVTAGYDTILWEIENKVRMESFPGCVHPDAMSKAEFQKLLDYAKQKGLKAIPLMQTFGHGEYVLSHPEYFHLRELPDHNDCYCSSSPEVAEFQKKLAAEYLELFGDIEFFHCGGDEAYVFGRCPKCRTRQRMELYAEHLLDVTEAIRARGIRCCVWGDMILGHRSEIGSVPHDFLIFDWHYHEGFDQVGDRDGELRAPFESSDFLVKNGFDVVLCSAAQSWSDSPFVPRFGIHARNIAGAAKKVRDLHLAGHCVTSWSLHNAPKLAQQHLFELGLKYRDADPAPDFLDELARNCAGVDAVLFGRLCGWRKPAQQLWCLNKDGRPVPPGFGAERRSAWSTEDRAEIRDAAALQSADCAEFAARRVKTEFTDLMQEGFELKRDYLGLLVECIEGTISLPRIEAYKLRLVRYYETDMTHGSAVERVSLLLDGLAQLATA